MRLSRNCCKGQIGAQRRVLSTEYCPACMNGLGHLISEEHQSNLVDTPQSLWCNLTSSENRSSSIQNQKSKLEKSKSNMRGNRP